MMTLTVQEQSKWKANAQKQRKHIIATQANSIFFSAEIKTRLQRGRVAYKYNSSMANLKKTKNKPCFMIINQAIPNNLHFSVL